MSFLIMYSTELNSAHSRDTWVAMFIVAQTTVAKVQNESGAC